MRKAALVLALAIISISQLQAQITPTLPISDRKVAARVAPTYPEVAKRMHIQGAVKIEAVVRPNGSVRSTRVLGGSPVLVEAAADAVKKWRFEPTQAETTEVVQISFQPE